jgi:quinolinate synthase
LRAPEIEKGVGCDFDNYLLVPDNTLDERIAGAKSKLGKDVVILGHHYQRDEVVKFADYRGDSLKLSQQAAEADAKYIVFCGVHFMAESADILRRGNQIVVLPDLNAGCSMADMADIGQVEACWDELSGVTRRFENYSGDLYEFERPRSNRSPASMADRFAPAPTPLR